MRPTKPVQVSDEESLYDSEEGGDDIADVLVLDEGKLKQLQTPTHN